MMSFVREKKWMSDGLSVVRGGPDNASEVCAKWRDHKMSQFFHLKLEQAIGTRLKIIQRIGCCDRNATRVAINTASASPCTALLRLV